MQTPDGPVRLEARPSKASAPTPPALKGPLVQPSPSLAPVASPPTPPGTIAPQDSSTFDLPSGNTSPGSAPSQLGSQLSALPQSSSKVVFSTADRAVLAAGLGLIRAARADLAAADKKTASAAQGRLIMAVFHLAGYIDGLGLDETLSDAGFSPIFNNFITPTLDDSLDDLESAIGAIISQGDTRSIRSAAKTIVGALGDVCISIGTGVIVASVVI